MLKFLISSILFISFVLVACEKQAVTTPIDGIYKGTYTSPTDTTRQATVPTEIQFEKGRFKFKQYNFSNDFMEGSFSLSDSTLQISQTKDEFCAGNCGCLPNVRCVFNPISEGSYTFKLMDNQLTLTRTNPLVQSTSPISIIVFNFKKQ